MRMMEIVDLTEDRLDVFLCCLKPEDMGFAGGVPLKREWYRRFRDRGVRVKLAIDEDGVAAGMSQYAPVDLSPSIEGEGGTWVIDCIWVHGYRSGIGDRRGKGMGPALLAASDKASFRLYSAAPGAGTSARMSSTSSSKPRKWLRSVSASLTSF